MFFTIPLRLSNKPFAYPISPAFYWVKKEFINKVFKKKVLCVELQAEPWIPSGVLTSTPVNEQFKSMDINRLKGNIAFASEIGVSRAYLWGAEWWYWLEKQGNKSFADYIMTLRKQ